MKSLKVYYYLAIWAMCLGSLSFASFYFNTEFEEREVSLVKSMELVRSLRSRIVDFHVSDLSFGRTGLKYKSLFLEQDTIKKLYKNLIKEDFGEKYFNESKDLNITYQQYLHKIKDGKSIEGTKYFLKLKRELNTIEKDLFEEVEKTLLDKILWDVGIDIILIMLALAGGIGLSLLLKNRLEELEESNEALNMKLSTNITLSSSGGWVLDFDNDEVTLTDKAIDICDINTNDRVFSLENFLELFSSEYSLELNEQLKLCRNQGDDVNLDLQIDGSSGEAVWLNLKGVLIEVNGKQRLEGVLCDIDLFKEAEDRFKTLFSNIGQPSFITSEQGLWDCNKAALKFFKLSDKEDFLDKTLPELFPLQQPDGVGSIKRLKHHMRKCSDNKEHRFVWSFRNVEGEVRSDVTMYPIYIKGNPLFMYTLKEKEEHVSVIKDKKYRVLICESNSHSRKILQSFFEEEEWIVKTADNMADALSLKEDIFFDMLVVDFSINDLNLDLFTLNQDNTHLVGMGGTGVESTSLRDKVDFYLQKPIMKEVVIGIIQKVVFNADKLILEDVLDLYSGRYNMLTSYCNELEVYLDRFQEQFEKNLEFNDWDQIKETVYILQSVSKKFSCRGLDQLFQNYFLTLNSRNTVKVKNHNKVVVSSFKELIANIRIELGKRAA